MSWRYFAIGFIALSALNGAGCVQATEDEEEGDTSEAAQSGGDRPQLVGVTPEGQREIDEAIRRGDIQVTSEITKVEVRVEVDGTVGWEPANLSGNVVRLSRFTRRSSQVGACRLTPRGRQRINAHCEWTCNNSGCRAAGP